ncbi:hypothetical protein COCOBI_09-3680 [Coccomyxa sp. Obi]|nr:hypothetical protein COCOBI_09-3680 [Coccomyxa sp. Obi]
MKRWKLGGFWKQHIMLAWVLLGSAAAQSPSPSGSPSYSPSNSPSSSPGYSPGGSPSYSPGSSSPAPGPSGGNGSCSINYSQALSPNKPGQGVGGLGIALASDGSVALLSGSPASGSQAASAYIYSFYTTAGQYNSCPQEIRDPAPLSGLRWGSSYAVSGDASVILVGAAGRVLSGAVYGGQDRGIDGKVYVYKLPELPGATRGYSVTDQPFLPPANTKSPFFGSGGLAATVGGETIFVGAPVAPQPTPQLSALYGNASVFVYTRSADGKGWTAAQTLPAPSGANNTDFGRKVVVADSGKWLVVSDPQFVMGPQSCGIFGAMPGYLTSGQVYVYQQQGDQSYKLTQTLQGNTTSATGFGADIDLSADGSVLVVGAPDSIASPRLVKVYALENNMYVERANITAPAGAPDNSRFGQQVSVSGDGQLLVVHAPLPFPRTFTPGPTNDDAGGRIYSFKLVKGSNGVSVAQQTAMVCPNNQYISTQRTCEDFGSTLALSANGKLLLTSGGFPGPPETLGTYVYQTQNCVSPSSTSAPSV